MLHFLLRQNITLFANLRKEWMRLISITIPPIFDRIGLVMHIQDIPTEKGITSDPTFAKKSKRKNHFLAACKGISSHITCTMLMWSLFSVAWLEWMTLHSNVCFLPQKICGCMQCFTMRPLSWKDTLYGIRLHLRFGNTLSRNFKQMLP